jgi:hypothetical protein
MLIGNGNAVVGKKANKTLSTNRDWASLVLQDADVPTSSNNVTTILDWMSSEGPASSWWTGGNPDPQHINPLNNGLGSGGGAGLGSYTSLPSAAHYVALNLTTAPAGFGYGAIVSDLMRSAQPTVTAQAIWASSWAGSHYGYGSYWNTAPVATAAAPQNLWSG